MSVYNATKAENSIKCFIFHPKFQEYWRHFLIQIKDLRQRVHACNDGEYSEIIDGKVIKKKYKDDKEYVEQGFMINLLIQLYEKY